MGAPDVLARLSARGVRLERDGAALVATPKAALTDELRALIRQHKPELLQALSGDSGDKEGEIRQLIEAIAAANSAYWKPADVEEAYRVALGDLDNALTCFRALAEDYGLEVRRQGAARA
jgi:hypothetical protein